MQRQSGNMSHPYVPSLLRSEVSVDLNHQMTTVRGDVPIPPPPYELLGVISNSEWDERLHAILTSLNRSTWSLWLRIYVLVGFIVSCALPWPIILLVQRHILGSRAGTGLGAPFVIGDSEGHFVVDDSYFEDVRDARIASGGIMLGTWFFIWLPLFIYLAVQSHRLAALLHSYTTTDSLKGTHQALRWSLSRTRFLRRTSLLTIGLPSKLAEATSFHPSAYINQQLPPYVERRSYDRPPSGGSGHARRRSGSSVASGKSAGSVGSGMGMGIGMGRERPEQRARFDYRAVNSFGAPLVPRFAGAGHGHGHGHGHGQMGGIRAPYRV